MLPLRERINSTTVTLVYLLAVVILSSVFERWAAITASILASLLLNFFFIQPYYTLTIDEPRILFRCSFFSLSRSPSDSFRPHRIAAGLRPSGFTKRSMRRLKRRARRKDKAKRKTEKRAARRCNARLSHAAYVHKASVTMLIEENEFGSREKKLDRHSKGELLEVINEETDRLNTFVDSMVEVARFQQGQTELRLVHCRCG
jgi:K+-sensing histidine kinase KdpD